MSSTTRAHIEVHPTGQAIGLVAGGASVQVSGEGSVEVSQATPLTKKGEEITTFPGAETPDVPMQHATWAVIDPTSVGVRVIPSPDTNYAKSMQLLFSPAEDVLSPATFFSGAEWLYKAPIMPAGYTYVITLTQFPVQGSARVFANLSAIIRNTAA